MTPNTDIIRLRNGQNSKSQSSQVQKAKAACFACRRNKRKCDRIYPECQVCTRAKRTCCYPKFRGDTNDTSPADERDGTYLPRNAPVTQTVSPPLTNQGSPTSITGKSAVSITALQFLAPETFKHFLSDTSGSPDMEIPEQISVLFGQRQDNRDTCIEYFEVIGHCIAFIWRKSFLSRLLNPLLTLQADFILLAVSMRLFLSHTAVLGDVLYEVPGIREYEAIKSFFWKLLDSGVSSLYLVQTGVIIATYELSHALQPSAHVTIGACALLAQSIGLHKSVENTKQQQSDGNSTSWIEIEEKRRTWWAILIVDRLVALNNPTRPLSTGKIDFECLIPRDDSVFMQELAVAPDPESISTGFGSKMGLFSRLVQGMYLLSQTFEAISTSSNNTSSSQGIDFEEDTTQLRRTLLALIATTEAEARALGLPCCSPSALCYCSIFLLQEHDWKIKKKLGQKRTIWDDTRTAFESTFALANRVEPCLAEIPGYEKRFPAILIQVLYISMRCYMSADKDALTSTDAEHLHVLKHAIQLIRPRWGLAEAYSLLIQAQEDMKDVDL